MSNRPEVPELKDPEFDRKLLVWILAQPDALERLAAFERKRVLAADLGMLRTIAHWRLEQQLQDEPEPNPNP